MPATEDLPDVLTPSDAAVYLRVSEEDIVELAEKGELPGRKVKNQWRFLKSGLQDWLSSAPRPAGKEALLRMAGKFKDDPFLEEIVREAYERRGRPITESSV